MANAILNFHFDYLNPSLNITPTVKALSHVVLDLHHPSTKPSVLKGKNLLKLKLPFDNESVETVSSESKILTRNDFFNL